MKAGTIAALSVLITAVLLSVLPVRGEERIYDNVIRLHVTADSDEAMDQHRKLLVRDRVLEVLSPMLRDAADTAEAAQLLNESLGMVKDTAEAALRTLGDSSAVEVQLTKEAYPTRLYDTFAMPAGEYLSLQITIGSGQGHNWWCVLFPTVCGKFATSTAEVWQAAGFTPEEYRFITGDAPSYKIRFRILEILEGMLW